LAFIARLLCSVSSKVRRIWERVSC